MNEANRNTIRALILSEYKQRVPEFVALGGEECNKIVADIEKGCFNAAIMTAKTHGYSYVPSSVQLVQIYSSHVMKIIVYANVTILDLVQKKESAFSLIVRMPRNILVPHVDSDLYETIEKRRNQAIERKCSDMYVCKKCGGNKTVTAVYQSRSGDEAPTVSILCIICSHIWHRG